VLFCVALPENGAVGVVHLDGRKVHGRLVFDADFGVSHGGAQGEWEKTAEVCEGVSELRHFDCERRQACRFMKVESRVRYRVEFLAVNFAFVGDAAARGRVKLKIERLVCDE
jgi:hypothetical protein